MYNLALYAFAGGEDLRVQKIYCVVNSFQILLLLQLSLFLEYNSLEFFCSLCNNKS